MEMAAEGEVMEVEDEAVEGMVEAVEVEEAAEEVMDGDDERKSCAKRFAQLHAIQNITWP